MHRVLLTFGDSWPQGGELKFDDGERPYGELLRDRMGFTRFWNYGSGGASNEDMLYQLQDYLQTKYRSDNQEVVAIFHLTNPARTAHWPRFTSWDIYGSRWTHWTPEALDHLKKIYLHFNDPRHEIMRSSATITALQQWCKTYSIRDYYFAGWVKYSTWLPGVDTSKIWAEGKETAADWFGATEHNGEHLTNVKDNPYIAPKIAHPNPLGHELIADRLQQWIQQ